MRLYDCKVLLGGSRDNEVRKTDVSAAEIMILRAFHGEDSIVEIVPKQMDRNRSSADERKRLFSIYVGASENENLGGFQKERAAVLTNLFGPSHMQLPSELPEKPVFAEEVDEPSARRTVVPKPKAGKAEDVAAAMQ